MVMNEDEKLKELLSILEEKKEVVEVNLPELVRLMLNGEITPEEFEETFKKRFKDILQ
jgi:hypothetical protein